MTVAQLVHPAYSVARHSRRAVFQTLHQTVRLHPTRDAALWRSIGIGAGFAASGFALMASAFIG